MFSDVIQKELIQKALGVGVAVFLVLSLLHHFEMGISFILGIVLALLNLWLIAKEIIGIRFYSGKEYTKKILKGYFFRYIILGLSFYLIFLYRFDVLSFILGFFSVKFLLILDQFRKTSLHEKK